MCNFKHAIVIGLGLTLSWRMFPASYQPLSLEIEIYLILSEENTISPEYYSEIMNSQSWKRQQKSPNQIT